MTNRWNCNHDVVSSRFIFITLSSKCDENVRQEKNDHLEDHILVTILSLCHGKKNLQKLILWWKLDLTQKVFSTLWSFSFTSHNYENVMKMWWVYLRTHFLAHIIWNFPPRRKAEKYSQQWSMIIEHWSIYSQLFGFTVFARTWHSSFLLALQDRWMASYCA